MALLYINGFDHYSDSIGVGNKAYDLDPGHFVDGNDDPVDDHQVFDVMPSLGGRGLAHRWASRGSGANNQATFMSLPRIPSSGEVTGLGFHFYMESLPLKVMRGVVGLAGSAGAASPVLGFPGGLPTLWNISSSAGVVLATGALALNAGVLYHLEIKIVHHASAGSFELRVDGVEALVASGINTLPTNRSHIAIGTRGETGADSGRFFIDNLFIWDDTGLVNNDWLGERLVYTMLPDGDTAQADWSLSNGIDGYALINQVPPNGAVDYLESSSSGEESIFTLSDLDTVELLPIGVQTVIQAQKTSAGTVEVEFGPDTGTSQDLSAPEGVTQNQFLYHTHISEINPDTGEFWTPAELNALRLAIKRA